jgi:hypothetical protein
VVSQSWGKRQNGDESRDTCKHWVRVARHHPPRGPKPGHPEHADAAGTQGTSTNGKRERTLCRSASEFPSPVAGERGGGPKQKHPIFVYQYRDRETEGRKDGLRATAARVRSTG